MKTLEEDESKVVEADKLYVCLKSDVANTGDYAKDKELLAKDHYLK